MLTTAAGFPPTAHVEVGGVPPHMTVGSYLGTDVKLWFQANSVLRRPLAIWKLCVATTSTPFVRVSKPLVKYCTIPPAPTDCRSGRAVTSAGDTVKGCEIPMRCR